MKENIDKKLPSYGVSFGSALVAIQAKRMMKYFALRFSAYPSILWKNFLPSYRWSRVNGETARELLSQPSCWQDSYYDCALDYRDLSYSSQWPVIFEGYIHGQVRISSSVMSESAKYRIRKTLGGHLVIDFKIDAPYVNLSSGAISNRELVSMISSNGWGSWQRIDALSLMSLLDADYEELRKTLKTSLVPPYIPLYSPPSSATDVGSVCVRSLCYGKQWSHSLIFFIIGQDYWIDKPPHEVFDLLRAEAVRERINNSNQPNP